MSINLRITTEIRNSDGRNGNAIAINVLVNDIAVMVWHQTPDSIGAEPKFTARAQFAPEEFRVFTPEYKWVAEYVEAEKTQRLEVAFGFLPAVIDNAVDKMFHGVSRLEITKSQFGYAVIDPAQRHPGNREVMTWNQFDWKGPVICTGWDINVPTEEVAEDLDDTFVLFETDGRFTFGQAYKHDYSDEWDEREVENLTPHAFRAMREGWVRD